MDVDLPSEWTEEQGREDDTRFVSYWLEPTDAMRSDLTDGLVAWRYEVRVSETDDGGFLVNSFEMFKYDDGSTGEGKSPGNVRLPKSETEAVVHVEGLVQTLSQRHRFVDSEAINGI